MKTFARLFAITSLLLATIFLSSCDNAKRKIMDTLDGENPEAKALISAKLDTLEATVKIMKSNQKLSNQKLAEIEYIHLRIARELRYCVAGIAAGGSSGKGAGSLGSAGASSDSDPDSRFTMVTGGWGGGHIYNYNLVSSFFPYVGEGLDYEYVSEKYPFDESNALPTASSNADDIMNQLLK